jgi:hypothetical protein
LDALPVGAVQVFELVLHIGFPGDVRGVNVDFAGLSLSSIAIKSESIVEVALCHQTTGERGRFQDQWGFVYGLFEAELPVGLDGIAGLKRVHIELGAHELFVGSGLDVAAMVLVEVIELVVNVDGCGYVAVHNDLLFAGAVV